MYAKYTNARSSNASKYHLEQPWTQTPLERTERTEGAGESLGNTGLNGSPTGKQESVRGQDRVVGN